MKVLPSLPWPWQAGQPPLWVSPGQPATPSATPSLCPTPPKMAPSLSPNLPTMTPPTLWPLSNPAPLTGLRWRLWGRETEQTYRGQRSWGTSLLKKVRTKHIQYVHLFTVYTYIWWVELSVCKSLCHNTLCTCSSLHIWCCAFGNRSSNNININLSTPTYTYCTLRDSWWVDPCDEDMLVLQCVCFGLSQTSSAHCITCLCAVTCIVNNKRALKVLSIVMWTYIFNFICILLKPATPEPSYISRKS